MRVCVRASEAADLHIKHKNLVAVWTERQCVHGHTHAPSNAIATHRDRRAVGGVAFFEFS